MATAHGTTDMIVHDAHDPDVNRNAQYVLVAAVLAVLTAIEVATYLMPKDIQHSGFFAVALCILMSIKFVTVTLFFIHAGNDYSTGSGTSLDAELARLGKPHRLEIYPAVGRTPDEGHDFPLNSVATWEPDVFAFLDPYMRK